MLHKAFDLQRRGLRTLPTDSDLHARRWMNRNAVWFHVTGNSDRLIGRICNHAERVVAYPALNKIVIRCAGGSASQRRIDLNWTASSDP